MADCLICGKPLGFWHSCHAACESALASAKSDIETIFVGFTVNLNDNTAPSPVSLQESVSRRAQQFGFTEDAVSQVVLAGLTAAAKTAFSERDVSDRELEKIATIVAAFNIRPNTIAGSAAFAILTQVMTLRDLRRGLLPTRHRSGAGSSIVLKVGDQIIWSFGNSTRLEMKTAAHYEGGSQGVSIRIVKGISYRVGAFKGRRVETNSLANCGAGSLVVTNKRVQFLSPAGNKSIDISAIEVVDRYSDGIGITPKHGKAQFFIGVEPLFAADLILSAATFTERVPEHLTAHPVVA
jgi:hypothetical protein